MSLDNILLIPGVGGGATPPAFSPTDIASLLWWYDPSDLSTLFQDSAGTTPVTSDGDPVGRVLDKSGNGYHRIQPTSGNRLTYRTSGGLHWLEYGGVDDGMYTATTVDHSVSDEVTVCVGASRVSGNNNATVLENSSNALTNNGTFRISANGGSIENWEFGLRGTTSAGNFRYVTAGSTTNVVSLIGKLLSGAIALDEQLQARRDAVDATVTGAPTTGGVNFGNHVLYFGRRNNATNPWQGNEYQSCGFTTVLSGTDLSNIESFVANKTGVSL